MLAPPVSFITSPGPSVGRSIPAADDVGSNLDQLVLSFADEHHLAMVEPSSVSVAAIPGTADLQPDMGIVTDDIGALLPVEDDSTLQHNVVAAAEGRPAAPARQRDAADPRGVASGMERIIRHLVVNQISAPVADHKPSQESSFIDVTARAVMTDARVVGGDSASGPLSTVIPQRDGDRMVIDRPLDVSAGVKHVALQPSAVQKPLPSGQALVERDLRDVKKPTASASDMILERAADTIRTPAAGHGNIAMRPEAASMRQLMHDSLIPVGEQATTDVDLPFGALSERPLTPLTGMSHPGLPSTLETPRFVALQMAAAVRQTEGGATEIALNPEELGRVRLQISVLDGALVLQVNAERPETTDLLRRHIDMLAQEFRALGFSDLTFSFGEGRAQDQKDSLATPRIDALPDDANIVEIVSTIKTGEQGALDLRL